MTTKTEKKQGRGRPAGTDKKKVPDILKAVDGCGGNVSIMAKRLKVHWHTAKGYIERYPTVKRAFDDEMETVSDKAESNLVLAIKDGDLGISKWWLARCRSEKFRTVTALANDEEDSPLQIKVVGFDIQKV